MSVQRNPNWPEWLVSVREFKHFYALETKLKFWHVVSRRTNALMAVYKDGVLTIKDGVSVFGSMTEPKTVTEDEWVELLEIKNSWPTTEDRDQ